MTAAAKAHDRATYEGTGGWNDGRLGQAQDLILEALPKVGGHHQFNHPIIEQIKALDEQLGQGAAA